MGIKRTLGAGRPWLVAVVLVTAGAVTGCGIAADPAPSGADAGPTDAGTAPAVPTTDSPTTVISTTVPEDVAQDSPVAAGPDSVRVTVTYAALTADGSAVEVSAVVAGVVEDGGTCTAVVSGAGVDTPITSTSPATSDATTTVCRDVVVPWAAGKPTTVLVSYSSPTTATVSASSDVAAQP